MHSLSVEQAWSSNQGPFTGNMDLERPRWSLWLEGNVIERASPCSSNASSTVDGNADSGKTTDAERAPMPDPCTYPLFYEPHESKSLNFEKESL
jgi:hypothetical protein